MSSQVWKLFALYRAWSQKNCTRHGWLVCNNNLKLFYITLVSLRCLWKVKRFCLWCIWKSTYFIAFLLFCNALLFHLMNAPACLYWHRPGWIHVKNTWVFIFLLYDKFWSVSLVYPNLHTLVICWCRSSIIFPQEAI